MKKQWQLIRVLLKCARTGDSEKKESKINTLAAGFSWLFDVALVVVMFFLGRFIGEHQSIFGSSSRVFGNLLIVSGVSSFALTFMTAINQLYMSNDLGALVTLPFTPMQIVIAKLAGVMKIPTAICLGLNIPTAIGFMMTGTGFGGMFLPSVIVGAIVADIYGVSLSVTLVIILMRSFRFIRSKNLISVFTTLLVFAVSVVYIIFSNSASNIDEQQAAAIYNSINVVSSGIGVAFPHVELTVKAMEGNALNLLIAVAIGAAAAAVMLVCAKTMYFQAALAITDANGKRGAIGDKEMGKFTSSRSPEKTLMVREFKNIIHTPSLIANGYLFSWFAPFLIFMPILSEVYSNIKEAAASVGSELNVEFLRDLVGSLGLSVPYFLLIGSLVGLVLAATTVGVSCLSRYFISREGKDLYVLKSMPITMRMLVMVKRRVVFCFNGLTGCLIPSLAAIAMGVLGIVPLWIAVVWAIDSCAWLVWDADYCMLIDLRKPNLNWESDASVTKTNGTGLLLFLAAFIMAGGCAFLLLFTSAEWLPTVLGYALSITPVVLAVSCECMIRRAADKL